MNRFETVTAALSRLHQEVEACRDQHQRRRLRSIEQSIRKAIGVAEKDETQKGAT